MSSKLNGKDFGPFDGLFVEGREAENGFRKMGNLIS